MNKKFIYMMLAIVIPALAYAQAPTILLNQAYGGSNFDQASCISKTSDGGYIIAGSSLSLDGDLLNVSGQGEPGDCMVLKISSSGGLQWAKKYGGFQSERFNTIIQTSDGGYMMGGVTASTNGDVTTGAGGWLVKTTANGNIEWQLTRGSQINAIKQTTDGGYIVGGDYLTKLDATGIIQWTFQPLYIVRSLCQTADGGYATTGEAYTNRANDFRVSKFNSSGNLERELDFGGYGDDNPSAILQTDDAGYIVAGSTTSNNNGNVSGYQGQSDFWVIKLSSTLTLQWQKALGTTGYETCYGMVKTNDGGYVLVGDAAPLDENGLTNTDLADGWIVKIGATGNLLWDKTLGGSQPDTFRGIVQNADGSLVITGFSSSEDAGINGFHTSLFNYNVSDAWLVKIDGTTTLPITFGSIDAKIKNNILLLNWTSLSESNNDYYIVEASKDGKTFTAISDKIFSKTENGNSSAPITYGFTKKLPVLPVMAWLCLLIGFRKRKQLQYFGLFFIACYGLSVWSCKKDRDELSISENQQLYLRIAQLDKDGTKTYSEIITVNSN